MKTLILYSTVDGHTHSICQFIAEKLMKSDEQEVELCQLSDFNGELINFDTVIIGASIRYGKHRPYVHDFVRNNKAKLNTMNTAFFSVNLVARKTDKNTANTNSYVQKFMEATDWQPDVVDVFAGKLDYSIYGLFDKLMIKLIMKITKGATSSDKPIVYTDWDRVERFVEHVFKEN